MVRRSIAKTSWKQQRKEALTDRLSKPIVSCYANYYRKQVLVMRRMVYNGLD
jgi:hypothetical protein